MRPRTPPLCWVGILQILFSAGLLYAESTPSKVERPGEPFNTFRSLDAQLSLLDAQFGRVQREYEMIGKIRNPLTRKKAYSRLPPTQAVRETRANVISIAAATQALAARPSMRKSRYGRVTFRALTRKAQAMKRSLNRFVAAKTERQGRARLQQFSRAMLAFIMQFQAVSGGYGALQCSPGEWTCCSPKYVATRRTAALKGCRWLCVKKVARCRSGCLGPRIPTATAQTGETRKPGLR